MSSSRRAGLLIGFVAAAFLAAPVAHAGDAPGAPPAAPLAATVLAGQSTPDSPTASAAPTSPADSPAAAAVAAAPSAVPSNVPPQPVPVLSAPPEAKTPDKVVAPSDVGVRFPLPADDDNDGGDRIALPDVPKDGGIPQGEDQVPAGLSGRVRKFIQYFQNRGRDKFELWLARSGKYAEMMRDILGRYGLPGDLVYLALIESGFSPHAYSVAKAAGPWQFIAGTAKRYGLRMDWWADERRDYEKSTHAAASYLKDLYGIFESWDLAAAAYNAGEGKIMRAVEKYKTEDYTELIRYRYLKAETKDYVPKMYAALSIAKEPEKYGFGDVKYEDPLSFDKVEVPGGTDLRVLGEILGIPYESLREWNPEIRRFCTPPNRLSYEIRLPKGGADDVREHMEEIRTHAKVTFLLHAVRKGESLDSLSEKYHAAPELIRELNGLKRNSISRSASLLVPVTGLSAEEALPGKEVSPEQLAMAHMRVDDGVRRSKSRKVVKVRRGETLARIAKRVGVPADVLAEVNGLDDGAKLRAGQRLYLPAAAAMPRGKGGHAATGKKAAPVGKAAVRHVVRRGDTLEKVARIYGVSVASLSNRNRIKPGRLLSEGRVLVIPAES